MLMPTTTIFKDYCLLNSENAHSTVCCDPVETGTGGTGYVPRPNLNYHEYLLTIHKYNLLVYKWSQ